jgi:Trypsin-like peptidase domain
MLQKDDMKTLDEFSLEDLVNELRAREATQSPGAAAADSSGSNEALRQFDSQAIAKAVNAQQKVIYGTDDRQDVFEITDPASLNDIDSVVSLFDASDVVDNGDGTSTLKTQNFRTSQNLCPTERFGEQPIGCFCSGFLVAPDVIATAGHCVNTSNVTNVRFVFGFRMLDAATAQTQIDNAEIYSGVSIIGREEVATGPDWALVRIDRAVTNHALTNIRREGRVGDGQTVHVIGHPVGLPTKFAGGAAVRDNEPSAFFVANLDTYGGNSGSPVFNSDTHEVEGILVRGETDFVTSGNCRVSLVCPSSGCRGEDVTRTTVFANLVPPVGDQ